MPQLFKKYPQSIYDPEEGWGEGIDLTPLGWVLMFILYALTMIIIFLVGEWIFQRLT